MSDGALDDQEEALEICNSLKQNNKVTIASYLLEDMNWKNTLSENRLIGPYSLRSVPAHLETFAPFKVAGNYFWKDENTIEMTIRYIESPHHWKITYQMHGDRLKLKAINSYAPKITIDLAGN